MHSFISFTFILSALQLVAAHVAPWHVGMYCLNGTTGKQDLNSNNAVSPLYEMSRKNWWMHHYDGCDQFPPADGDFLELPAGGSFTVEMGTNRAKTSLSYRGRFATDWPDGQNYPEPYDLGSKCITSPNLHAHNEASAAGSAFAISYVSDLSAVTPENLVVFTVRKNTPFKRFASFDVPAEMPACPEGGCICAWGWIPNGCGQPNMYMLPYKCRVTGASSTKAVGTGQPAVWCEDDPSKCVGGPKQMLYWNQLEGNNIEVRGLDLSGKRRSPGYNTKCGFDDGAQNDIFTGKGTSSSSGQGGATDSDSDSSSAPELDQDNAVQEDPASTDPSPTTEAAPATTTSSETNSDSSSAPELDQDNAVQEDPASTDPSPTTEAAPATTTSSETKACHHRQRRRLDKKSSLTRSHFSRRVHHRRHVANTF